MTDDAKDREIESLRARVAELEARNASLEAWRDATLESLPFDFFALDRDGRYVLQNSTCLRNWGDVVGKRPVDLPVDEATRAVWAENIPRALAGEVVAGEINHVVSGERKFVYNVLAPVKQGDRVGGIVGVNVDITDLEEAREALAQSEERYRALAENRYTGLFLAEAETARIIYANEAMCDVMGYTRDEMIELTLFDLASPDDSSKASGRVDARSAGRDLDPPAIVYTARRKDGSTLRAEVLSALVTFQGKPVIQGIVRDVSEMESLQEKLIQADKMHAIGTMAGGISHDFNNILHAILGYTQLLLRDKDEGHPDHERLREVERLTRRASRLTGQLLTFSRRSSESMQPVDLNAEIAQARNLVMSTAGTAIEFEMHLARDLRIVRADPGQIEQVLLNLVVNARDAMPRGGRLLVATENMDWPESRTDVPRGQWVRLTVSDTGEGMDAETVRRMYEPFFTTKATGMGTGLGLSVVYGIVQGHEGHISCESKPGEGTTFRVDLPALRDVERTDPAPATEPVRGGSETILVVDDERYIRELGRQTLAESGYEVLLAKNGVQALDAVASRRVDLVLLDMVMPEMDGRECLEGILEADPGARVVIASGFSAGFGRAQALAMGARDCLSKPYDAQALLATIRKVLERD